MISSIGRILNDVDDESYLLARCYSFAIVQLTNMTDQGDRNVRGPLWRSLLDSNPLITVAFHDNHWQSKPAFQEQDRIWDGWIYRRAATQVRSDVVTFIDVDDDGTEFHGNRKSQSDFRQTGWTPRYNSANMRNWYADAAHDFLTGGSLASSPSLPITSIDVSDRMVFYHDSTHLSHPNSNQQFMRPVTNGTGNIVSIDSQVGSQIRTVTIDKQPGAGVEAFNIFFWKGTTGFIGYRIDTYTAVGGGNSQLTLEAFPSTAGTQIVIPDSSYDYCICNRNNDTDTGDWLADGTGNNNVNAFNDWFPAFDAYWDRINSNVLATTGHHTGRGFNSCNRSFQTKESEGWPVPHGFTQKQDYPGGENYSDLSGFDHGPASGPHEYDTSNTNMTKYLRAINWAKSYVKTSQNTFMANRASGAQLTVVIWGTSWNDPNDLDANVYRFFHMLHMIVGDGLISTHGGFDNNGNANFTPIGCEECFLDFDTNAVSIPAIGTYNEDDGNGTIILGPGHEWLWGTPDFGERGYIRRLGNFLVAINCADNPSAIYAPNHLPGGMTPRDPQDTIKPADFSALVGKGYLSAGEQIRHWNPATYINTRATVFNQNENPSHWSGFNVGPEQPHPNDSDGAFNLATTPAILRDPTLNDGSTVNMGADYPIGGLQTVAWEVF